MVWVLVTKCSISIMYWYCISIGIDNTDTEFLRKYCTKSICMVLVLVTKCISIVLLLVLKIQVICDFDLFGFIPVNFCCN